MTKIYRRFSDGNLPSWLQFRIKSILLLLVFTFLASGLAVGQIAPHVVISEVYGGGGNTGAPYNADFIELYNPTNEPVNLNGWSVQYASNTGTTWTRTNLPNVLIQAKGFFLVKCAVGNGNADLPAFDATSSISISGLAGKVALVNNVTTLAGTNPTDASIVDRLGWGTATGFEGSVGPGTATTNSIERKASSYSTTASMAAGGAEEISGNGFDTNDNSFDFIITAVPNPQFSGSAIEQTPSNVPAPVAPTVVTNQVSSMKAVTATANGNITANGGSKVVERGFVYMASATAVTPTLETAGVIKKSTVATATAPIHASAFTESLTGLVDNTTYYIRAFATNGVGTSYGDVQQFTTISSSQLSEVYLSSGTLTPAFSPSTQTYTATVDNSIAFIDIVPTFANPGATATINGTAVTSGSGMANFPLAVGENAIAIVVTAPTGGATTTYNLTVTRTAESTTMGMANHLVISEIYAGAGEAGPYTNDFVELYNPTDAPISVAGWSIQVAGATGTTWVKTNLPAKTIPAKGYFLFQGATGTGGTGSVAITGFDDNLSGFAITSSAGRIALVNNNVTLTVANPVGASIVDKVAWGTATTGFEGALAPAFTGTTSLERKATATSTAATMADNGSDATRGNGYDSNNNSFDFVISTPRPQNLAAPLEGEVAPTVTTAAATAITTTGATIGGNVTSMGSGPVTERGIIYIASNSVIAPTIETQGVTKLISANAGTGAFSESATSLSVFTKYYARAYAINAFGTAYGNVVEFTTDRSTNANLSGVSFSAGTMAPAFDENTIAYRTSVSAGTNTITLTPTLADPNARVTVNGTAVASGSTSGAIPLTAGDNSIAVAVTAQDGTTVKTYTFTVNRALTDHLVISEVYGGAGNTGAVYSSDYVELYNPTNADIVMDNWSIQYASSTGTTWSVNVISGTVKAKGYFLVKQLTSSGANPIPTPDASGSLNISGFRGKILLANNATPVTGANPTDANIVDLVGWGEANSSGTAGAANGFEGFRAPTTNESTALERKANNYSTTETMATGGADEMKGNGFDSNDNSFDFVLSAPNPQNSAAPVEEMTGSFVAPVLPTVTTTAATAIAAKSATLGGNVTANGGAKVSARGLVYVASATDVMPTIGMDGHIQMPAATMGSGAFNQPVTNLDFNTKYYVRAYATNEAGTTYGNVESFTTAAAGTNADLANLAISGATINPVFSSGVTAYTATVPNSTTSVSVTPVVADANATVSVNGSPVNLGSSPPEVALVAGENIIRIVVKAEDGTTTKTYTVTVVRAMSANANLSSLVLSSGTLAPAFDQATRAYNATVDYNVASITVTPTVTEPNATVRVNGNVVASGSASGAIALAEGNNTITTVVTAQDGTTTGTYTVTVYRTMLTAISPDLAAKNGFVLNAIYPNPMATEGAVKFTLAKSSAVQVVVYSVAGGKVMEEELGTFGAGSHDVSWMSAANNGTTLAPGIYIMHVVSNSGVLKARFVVGK